MNGNNKEQINLEKFIIKITDHFEEPTAILSIDNTVIATAGNLSVIGGKAKSKKTFFISMLAGAYLSLKYGNITGEQLKHQPKVLLFDTEQAKHHVYKILRRLYRMLGWDFNDVKKNLIVYALRELDVKQRQDIITKEIQRHKPALVVIDGVVDICEDFNSIEKSSDTVQMLMTLSSKMNCHIITVLHENKGDGNLRGHLGSILVQKAETVIQLTKDGESTGVEGTNTRNINFDSFYFTVDEHGLPVVTNAPTKTDKQLSNIKDNLKYILPPPKSMTYKDLYEAYAETTGLSQSTAKKHIADGVKNNIINKDDSKYYRWTIEV